ncbi:MAG: CoA transferase [Chloroflexi bacterium]|nr:CoA transferase [Chloroflexota bacterium]
MSFDEWMGEQGIARSTGRKWMQNYRAIIACDLPHDILDRIRWTKLNLIVSRLEPGNDENNSAWVERAEKSTRRDLEETVKAAQGKPKPVELKICVSEIQIPVDQHKAYFDKLAKFKTATGAANDSEAVLKLVDQADALLEGFRPGVMQRLGLDHATLADRYPKLIYCSISGFGNTGPDAAKGGFDLVAQGVSGLMSITGEADGEPQKVGIAVSDIGAGMWAAFAVMTALHHRERTGEGQYIDISMLDAQIAWLTYQAAYYFANNEPPKRLGAAHPTLVPYQAFMSQDGKYVNVAVGSERIWERFCKGIDRADLKTNPEFTLNGDRVRNRATLVPLLQEYFLTKPASHWVDVLQAVNVPAGPINDLADVFSDPQVLHRQMLLEMPHPTLKSIKQTGLPLKFSVTPGGLDRHPPLLGEHNQEILKDLGYSAAAVERLAEKSII